MKREFTDDEETRSISGGKTALFACVATLLVASPLVINAAVAATAPEDEVTYRSTELVERGNAIEYRQGPGITEGLLGIDCDAEPDRECLLERQLLGNEATFEYNDGFGGSPDTRYASHHGELYERTYDETVGTRTYGMRPVSGKEVLADVAVPVEESAENATVRRIIEGEKVTVDHLITHPADPDKEYSSAYQSPVYEYEGSYYALVLVSIYTHSDPRAGAVLWAVGTTLSLTGLIAPPLFLRRYDRIEL